MMKFFVMKVFSSYFTSFAAICQHLKPSVIVYKKVNKDIHYKIFHLSFTIFISNDQRLNMNSYVQMN